ncbi:KdsC family phosphatase [Desulfovibrio inopinatus]|uniref:KdsC family phosphatase n=1 Tax=Desulfovibrio inopinatus TaxID=102109 RepID=UPI0003FE7B76|nr:HAD hydrolase family protein [Desulfovibrio inopinatus]
MSDGPKVIDPKLAAKRVKLFVMDVDGVLTDGGVYYDSQGGTVGRRFNVQDGLGIKIAQAAGLDMAVISGLRSTPVVKRMEELGITEYHGGHLHKLPILEGILEQRGLDFSQVAFLGDDWIDASILKRVGLPMSVPNAQPEILEMAAWITTRRGGDGAVRDAIRFILDAQNRWEPMWRHWSA